MNKKEKIKQIHEKYSIECKCNLKKTATQAVYGDGNPDSDIVFIGEAPGKNEDKEGIPFIGSAGKFLTEMLSAIDLKREDIYTTNIVKYRPPNNRDPLPEEKASCKEWLLEELNLIKPKLIIFLGRHAMNTFFPNEKISDIHGKILIKKFKNFPTKYFFALYHPASALYNGGMREVLMSDFKKIPKILKEIDSNV
ncbi:MAG: uracil-DNA glycosylase [Candidatus Paceibacterota bacterium]|jgi:DNA polymerase